MDIQVLLPSLVVALALATAACADDAGPEGADTPTPSAALPSEDPADDPTPDPTADATVEPTPTPPPSPTAEPEPTRVSDSDPAPAATTSPTDDDEPSAPTTAATPAAAAPIDDDRPSAEPDFTADEAAALTCANLENGLEATELDDLEGIAAALEGAAAWAGSTDSPALAEQARDWSGVDDLDTARELLRAGLDTCVMLGYQL